MDILTEFDNIHEKFLISIFINGLNYEIKILIGIQSFPYITIIYKQH